MANIRLIKRRIRGVQSTAKITKAMQMIAASRMRRAQERGLAGRPYAEKMLQVITDLASLSGDSAAHPLLQKRSNVKNISVLYITPDRGFNGGLVSNLNRKLLSFMVEQKAPVRIVAVGRKGRDFMRRQGSNIQAEFTGISGTPNLVDTLPMSHIIIDDYSKGAVDQVFIVYTQFVNTMVQRPVLTQLLPAISSGKKTVQNVGYIYEPGSASVLNSLLPRYVDMQVYHAILESIASEQSARMVAMKNATDNAEDLITDLTLVHNKARQDAITKELLDIVAGTEAVS